MAQVMNMGVRLARAGVKFKSPDQFFKLVLNDRISQPFASDGNEYVIFGPSHASPLGEVLLQTSYGGRMQRNEPALSEFRIPDLEAIGRHVVQPQRQRFRNSHARDRQQGEKSAVGMTP
jgi:hypothetical protein